MQVRRDTKKMALLPLSGQPVSEGGAGWSLWSLQHVSVLDFK